MHRMTIALVDGWKVGPNRLHLTQACAKGEKHRPSPATKAPHAARPDQPCRHRRDPRNCLPPLLRQAPHPPQGRGAGLRAAYPDRAARAAHACGRAASRGWPTASRRCSPTPTPAPSSCSARARTTRWPIRSRLGALPVIVFFARAGLDPLLPRDHAAGGALARRGDRAIRN